MVGAVGARDRDAFLSLLISVLSQKYLTILPPIHPVSLRWADLPRSEVPCEPGDSTAKFRQLISETEH